MYKLNSYGTYGITVLSSDPFSRTDNIREYAGIGSCYWCGREGKVYRYGTMAGDARPNFFEHIYCSVGCFRSDFHDKF